MTHHARQDHANRFGPYVLHHSLGSKRGRPVFLAEEEGLRRGVVVKCFSPGPHADAVLRHARGMARVSHPNLVTIHAAGRVGEQPYVAMELCPGITLEQLMAGRDCLDVARSLHVVRKAASALDAVHRAGMVHGSILPSHVLVDRTGIVRLLGAASILRSGEMDARFLAPEWRDSPDATPTAASDIYALGVLLVYLTVGKGWENPEEFPPVSTYLQPLVARLCAHLPGRRPTQPGEAYAEITSDLEALEAGGQGSIEGAAPRGRHAFLDDAEGILDLPGLAPGALNQLEGDSAKTSAPAGEALRESAHTGKRPSGRRVWTAGLALLFLAAVLAGLASARLGLWEEARPGQGGEYKPPRSFRLGNPPAVRFALAPLWDEPGNWLEAAPRRLAGEINVPRNHAVVAFVEDVVAFEQGWPGDLPGDALQGMVIRGSGRLLPGSLIPVGAQRDLRALRVEAPGINDAAVGYLVNMHALTYCDMPRAELTARGLRGLAALPNLRYLRIPYGPGLSRRAMEQLKADAPNLHVELILD